MSAVILRFQRVLEKAVRVVVEYGTVEDAIACLALMDASRKTIDKIQANPKGRPMNDQQRPEREGREGDTQPMPVGTDGPIMHEVVIEALAQRLEVGIRRYGQPLQAFNGRNAAQDAFEEVLDLSVYLAQVMIETEAMRNTLDKAVTWIAQLDCPSKVSDENGCSTCHGDSSLCPRQQMVMECRRFELGKG